MDEIFSAKYSRPLPEKYPAGEFKWKWELARVDAAGLEWLQQLKLMPSLVGNQSAANMDELTIQSLLDTIRAQTRIDAWRALPYGPTDYSRLERIRPTDAGEM